MTAVTISGTFKRDERSYNGLEAIAAELLDRANVGTEYHIVAKARVHAIKWTAEDGTEVPSVKTIHIEVVDGEDAAAVERMLKERFAARTGDSPQDTLPFDDGPTADRDPDVWLDDTAETTAKPKRRRS